MSTVSIKVTGASEIAAALRIIADSLPNTLNTDIKEAVDYVLPKIRAKVPRLTGRASKSLHRRENMLIGGGSEAPYYGWLDFGGRVGIRKSVVRSRPTNGRYIYPVITSERDGILEQTTKRILAQYEKRGLKVVRHG